jgi:hypothetical protein
LEAKKQINRKAQEDHYSKNGESCEIQSSEKYTTIIRFVKVKVKKNEIIGKSQT